MAGVTVVVYLFLGYLAVGALFALAFAWFGVGRIDAGAQGSSWGFRLIILPGAMALWPWLAARWIRGGGEPPAERNPHRDAAARLARDGRGAGARAEEDAS